MRLLITSLWWKFRCLSCPENATELSDSLFWNLDPFYSIFITCPFLFLYYYSMNAIQKSFKILIWLFCCVLSPADKNIKIEQPNLRGKWGGGRISEFCRNQGVKVEKRPKRWKEVELSWAQTPTTASAALPSTCIRFKWAPMSFFPLASIFRLAHLWISCLLLWAPLTPLFIGPTFLVICFFLSNVSASPVQYINSAVLNQIILKQNIFLTDKINFINFNNIIN